MDAHIPFRFDALGSSAVGPSGPSLLECPILGGLRDALIQLYLSRRLVLPMEDVLALRDLSDSRDK